MKRVGWTWVQGYNGVSTLAAMLVTGCLISGLTWRTVPSYGNAQLPLGMLAPPLLAAFAGLATSSSLPTPQAHVPWRLRAARALWLLVNVVMAGTSARLVELRYPVPGMTVAAGLLVLLTFGLSTILGRAAPLLGVVLLMALLANLSRLRTPELMTWTAPPVFTAAACLLGLLGAAAFIAWGSRGDTHFAG